MDNSQSVESQFPYHIIEFVAAGRKPKVRKTDIVATKWLQYDKQKKKIVTRYPPPPYDEEKSNELGLALQQLSDAPSTWPTYTISLRGKAVNLDEAHKKLELLKHQKTALTAESGESDTEAENKAANLIRQEEFKSAATAFNNSVKKKSTKRPSQSDNIFSVKESVTDTASLFKNHSSVHLTDGSPPSKKSTQYSNSVVKPLRDLTNTSASVDNKGTLKAILDCLTKLMTDVSNLNSDVKVMKADISKIKTSLNDLKKIKGKSMGFIATVPQLSRKYNYNIPFRTMEEFKTFNHHLSDNSELRESVGVVLQSGLDPHMVISKSIVSMLKMFLTKDLATQCVAVRKLEDKVPIRDTPFVQCMMAVIKEHRLLSNKETPLKDITSALSIVLSNAGQWYVARKSAENKTNPAPQSDDFQQPTTSSALPRVVAVEPTVKENMDNLDEIFAPLQFEYAEVYENEVECSEEYTDEFNEEYLSRLKSK